MKGIQKGLSWRYCSDCEDGIGRDRPNEPFWWDEKVFGKKPANFFQMPVFCAKCAKKRGLTD
jgi:hypothetical protein